MTVEQKEYVSDEVKVRQDLHKLIKQNAPKSCFAELIEGKELNVKIKEPTPKSILEQAGEFVYNEDKSITENVSDFTSQISKLTDKQILTICKNTIGQSNNDEWLMQRKWRITASNFYSVCTRTKNLQASEDENARSLISYLLGYKDIPDTAALKHGRSTEIHAKEKYLSLMKKVHKKLKSNESGLVVMKTKTFIAASPDLEISCECCSQGFVEIKCPYSIRNTCPDAENLKYLESVDGKVQLKTNTDYYYQIQGQMRWVQLVDFSLTSLFLLFMGISLRGSNLIRTFG